MIARLLNVRETVAVGISLLLAVILAIEALRAHRWKQRSAGFERSYLLEKAAFSETVAGLRAAADAARAADKANAERVVVAQRAINERTAYEFEARIGAARASARRLRHDTQTAGYPGAGGSAPMPGLPEAAGTSAQGALENRLPAPDALIATEQAIQLDELIQWVRAQAKVDNSPSSVASSPGDNRR